MNSKYKYLLNGKHPFQDLVDIDRLRNMFERFSQATVSIGVGPHYPINI